MFWGNNRIKQAGREKYLKDKRVDSLANFRKSKPSVYFTASPYPTLQTLLKPSTETDPLSGSPTEVFVSSYSGHT